MDTQDYRDRAERRRERFEQKARMFEERWERRMHERRGGRGGRIWTGAFLLVIGALLFARQAGVLFPKWFFTWPVFLIALGFWIGARHRFRGFGWAIPIVVGGIYLIDILSDDVYLKPYIWPVILMMIGAYFIFRPRRNRWHDDEAPRELPPTGATPNTDPANASAFENDFTADRADRLDVTAILGGIKKNVLSKTFKGGEITTFMGGAEINLAQADFEGRIKIDCTNVFGGTKLYLPPDWQVESELVAIFGGVDDKRPPVPTPAHNKVIVLDGTCLFGGVEIRSYY